MIRPISRRAGLLALATAAALGLAAAPAAGQQPRAGKIRVAIIGDMNNYDPQSFVTANFPLIKNLYDSLIEYTPDGKPVPSLATAWVIAPDSKSVTVTLRAGVKFHGGGALDATAVAKTLEKAADPKRGKNLLPTMAIVQDWAVVDAQNLRLNFKAAVPERQITDLLQFLAVIDPAGMETVETKPAGSGAYVIAERVTGQRIRFAANPAYWRAGEPLSKEVEITVFSDDASASAALESGAVDIVYGGTARSAVRLRGGGYQLIQGPGPLVQVFRINTTRGPFKNEKFRQAFNHLMDRAAILRVGYANLGVVTALPWAPANPAADPAYNTTHAFDLDKAKALIAASGLAPAEQSNWKMLVNGGDESAVLISQMLQGNLARVGITVQLDLKQGAEFFDVLLKGNFDTVFGAIGNIQKFPTRLTTNSIYRTANNPVLGEPHPHPAYVAAIARVDQTFGAGEAVKAAYDNLNKVIVELAFGIATNTFDVGLIVAAKKVGGFTLDIDNMLVLRNIGFLP